MKDRVKGMKVEDVRDVRVEEVRLEELKETKDSGIKGGG